MLHINDFDQNEWPVFMLDSDHLSSLKGKTKAARGERLDRAGKKALKLFRSNRSNKRG